MRHHPAIMFVFVSFEQTLSSAGQNRSSLLVRLKIGATVANFSYEDSLKQVKPEFVTS